MWKTDDFVTLTGLSVDFPSAASAGASFSGGPPVGSDNCEAWVGSAEEEAARRAAGRSPIGSVRRTRRWSTMASMAVLQRGESTIGPVAFGGRTIMLVARTTAVHIGRDAFSAVHVRSRPVHVEVLDEHGQRQVVPVRDVERALIAAIAIGGIAGACALRARGKWSNGKRRSP